MSAVFSYVVTLLIGDTKIGWTGDVTADPGVHVREDDVHRMVVRKAADEYGVGVGQVTVLALSVVKG